MAVTADIRMKNPAHPGAFVKTEILAPPGLSVTDAARALGVTRAALSTDMAIRVEKAFGVSMETLMRMQSSFAIVEARRAGEIVVRRFTGPSADDLREAVSAKRA